MQSSPWQLRHGSLRAYGRISVKLMLRMGMALAMALVTVWSFLVPDALHFQHPELARIFFWHFPCPMLASTLLVFGGWYSYKELKTRDRKWDVYAESANELGFLFCLLTMATGIMFSQVQWGTWWQNDPRQTSFLLVLLIYGAYFAIRAAHSDGDRRASVAAAYALAALGPALFLIFIFPRLPQIEAASFHPTQSIMKGQIKGNYAVVVSLVLILVSALSAWLFTLRVRAGLLELENQKNGLETHRSDPTPSGVVRPISVSSEN